MQENLKLKKILSCNISKLYPLKLQDYNKCCIAEKVHKSSFYTTNKTREKKNLKVLVKISCWKNDTLIFSRCLVF